MCLFTSRREAELVEHAIRRDNTEHMARMQERGEELIGLPELQQRLSLALRMRLELLQPHMASWPQVSGVRGQCIQQPLTKYDR